MFINPENYEKNVEAILKEDHENISGVRVGRLIYEGKLIAKDNGFIIVETKDGLCFISVSEIAVLCIER